MQHLYRTAGLTALFFVMSVGMAHAGAIERACMQSDHKAVSRSVCSCIQQVADQTLGGSDQRRAAKFFGDPDKANDVWLSQNRADDAFWERYKLFGSQAEVSCAGV